MRTGASTHEAVDLALREELKSRAREVGFSLVGVTSHTRSGHMDFYRSWVDEGLHGEMAYLARGDSLARRADLAGTMDSVRSVVVVAHEYFTPDADGVPDDPSLGVVARYARGADYHRVVKRNLVALLSWLDGRVEGGVRGRAYVDTGPILERELAQRAGLGWFGRNTLLINPARGSYFFIGLLLLDLDLPPDAPFTEDRCGSCHACLDACPTGALLGRDEGGAPVIDATRCISYLTIELRGPIPRELRPAMGNRIYGCDICQEVCPWNGRFAEPASDLAYAARGPGQRPMGMQPERGSGGEPPSDDSHPGTAAPSLIDLMRMTREQWEAFSRGSAIRRAGYEGFRRNVAVAMGNWLAHMDEPEAEAVDVLTEALRRGEPLVRRHAAWALGRAGTDVARSELGARLEVEPDPAVRSELEWALEP